MLLHGEIEYRLAQLHIEDLHNEAIRLRQTADARTSAVPQKTEQRRTPIEYQFWRRWRVRRRPAFGAA
jgi:hypothetical protein